MPPCIRASSCHCIKPLSPHRPFALLPPVFLKKEKRKGKEKLKIIEATNTMNGLSPLEELLQSAASDPDGDIEPTYNFLDEICYFTAGESDRKDALEKILTGLYLSIMENNFEHVIRWSEVLKTRIALEHSVPRRVRAALVMIYYDLALTPGMTSRPANVFCDMFHLLLLYVLDSRRMIFLSNMTAATGTTRGNCALNKGKISP